MWSVSSSRWFLLFQNYQPIWTIVFLLYTKQSHIVHFNPHPVFSVCLSLFQWMCSQHTNRALHLWAAWHLRTVQHSENHRAWPGHALERESTVIIVSSRLFSHWLDLFVLSQSHSVGHNFLTRFYVSFRLSEYSCVSENVPVRWSYQ